MMIDSIKIFKQVFVSPVNDDCFPSRRACMLISQDWIQLSHFHHISAERRNEDFVWFDRNNVITNVGLEWIQIEERQTVSSLHGQAARREFGLLYCVLGEISGIWCV